jgi:polyferredoxin
MGIDIRDGQQLECITCALCIDACDDVMQRIGKPRGLIDYIALKDEAAERGGAKPNPLMKHVLRPRTLLYFALWSVIGIGLVVALFLRSPLELNVTPVRNPVYVLLADGSIRNTYEVRLRNKQSEARDFEITATVSGPEGATVALPLTVEGAEGNVVHVAADETLTQRIYVTAPPNSDMADAGLTDITIWLQDVNGSDRASKASVFTGKEG